MSRTTKAARKLEVFRAFAQDAIRLTSDELERDARNDPRVRDAIRVAKRYTELAQWVTVTWRNEGGWRHMPDMANSLLEDGRRRLADLDEARFDADILTRLGLRQPGDHTFRRGPRL